MPYKDPVKAREAQRRSQARRRAAAKSKAGDAVSGLPDPPDRETLLRILGQRAREGNVPAARALLEELRRDVSDGKQVSKAALAEFDELASRRGKRAA